MILEVPSQVVSEVVHVTASTVKMGMQVGWMDKTWRKIASKRGHLDILKKIKETKKKLEQLEGEREEIARTFGRD